MTEKKPQTGEWWECDFTRVRIVGHRLDGVVITEAIGGFIGCIENEFGWKHLPDCDSFEWQPETFPQYWSTFGGIASVAYVEQVSKKEFREVLKDGTVNPIARSGSYSADGRKRLTREQAEALVQKPEPVESPDDWVTQDRVPDRPGIDQWRWVYGGKSEGDWRDTRSDSDIYLKHGYVDAAMDRFEVRCRRKDLPTMPQEMPKPSYVRLWTHRTSGTVCTATDEKYLKYPDIWTELKHDGTGFYLSAD